MGIGTTSPNPSYKLDVQLGLVRIQFGGFIFPLVIGQGGTFGNVMFGATNDALPDMVFGNNNSTEIMRITYSGKVGIGTNAPSTNALVDMTSTTKGFLPPRMTITQRSSISLPEEGLCVYDITLHKLYVYDGTSWQACW